MELASCVSDISSKHVDVVSDPYEAGEMIDGTPISFKINADFPLWKPLFTLRERMKRTMEWFKSNLSRYS